MRTISFLLLITCCSLVTANNSITRYTSHDGIVTLSIETKLGYSFVASLTFNTSDCHMQLVAGPNKGHLNHSVSVNWSSFAWTADKIKINGILVNPNTGTYLPSSVSWTAIKTTSCKINADSRELQLAH